MDALLVRGCINYNGFNSGYVIVNVMLFTVGVVVVYCCSSCWLLLLLLLFIVGFFTRSIEVDSELIKRPVYSKLMFLIR